MSAYVLHIVARAVDNEDKLFANRPSFDNLNKTFSRRTVTSPGPRTAILLRCDDGEAQRIREAAARRNIASMHLWFSPYSGLGAFDTRPHQFPRPHTRKANRISTVCDAPRRGPFGFSSQM